VGIGDHLDNAEPNRCSTPGPREGVELHHGSVFRFQWFRRVVTETANLFAISSLEQQLHQLGHRFSRLISPQQPAQVVRSDRHADPLLRVGYLSAPPLRVVRRSKSRDSEMDASTRVSQPEG
jgi:hypothetical protein